MSRPVCIVTGSASGIGLSTAIRMLEGGWSVVGIDIAADRLGEVSKTLAPQFQGLAGDVADISVLEQAVELATSVGTISCWVNNAGYNIRGMIHEIDQDTYRRGTDVVLGGVFWGTAVATRAMIEHGEGGCIVNMGSVHGSIGFEGGWAAYAMCKAGIDGLTRQVAADYGKFGIRCNAIAPGLIDTPINEEALGAHVTDQQRALLAQSHSPLARIGKPEDIAEMVHFLADEKTSRFITGQTYLVDGGLVKWRNP